MAKTPQYQKLKDSYHFYVTKQSSNSVDDGWREFRSVFGKILRIAIRTNQDPLQLFIRLENERTYNCSSYYGKVIKELLHTNPRIRWPGLRADKKHCRNSIRHFDPEREMSQKSRKAGERKGRHHYNKRKKARLQRKVIL